ncbi:HupE/UreJ family protein [Seohaeicola saemankumensis]|nr:HupE/UreJ family protein [Seohaeicola saemankumensis]MCA0872692.1 HupE/UreJ family protein [Seohaeicola saemankumensis]
MKRILSVALLGLGSPAWAHHPLAGQPMETLGHGLLSGLGHPVLGFDHLFFVLAMGLAARLAGVPLRGPLHYVVAMLAGCAALYTGWELPLREAMIALSLLVVGGVLASGRAMSPAGLGLMFGLFGLFHGAGFGTSIAAQEGGVSGAVLAGYLIGLGIVQYGLAIGAGFVVARVAGAAGAAAMPARLAGAMVAGAGLFLCLEAAEGPVLGWLLS